MTTALPLIRACGEGAATELRATEVEDRFPKVRTRLSKPPNLHEEDQGECHQYWATHLRAQRCRPFVASWRSRLGRNFEEVKVSVVDVREVERLPVVGAAPALANSREPPRHCHGLGKSWTLTENVQLLSAL